MSNVIQFKSREEFKKEVYQYHAEALDLDTGEVHRGCFKTFYEADEFVLQKRREGLCETLIQGRKGCSPYGTWVDFFDVEKYFSDLEDWFSS